MSFVLPPLQFKIAVAVPPQNDVDVFTNDLGFIAIVDEKTEKVLGYNVTVGGGMGVTHSNTKTYPRLGDVIGFVTPEEGIHVAEAVMLTQRDNGNRADRKNAVSQDEHALLFGRDAPSDSASVILFFFRAASEIHRRPNGSRRVQGRRRAPVWKAAPARATVQVHQLDRRVWVANRPGRQPPLHHVHRERSRPGRARAPVQDRSPRDRKGAHRLLPADGQPAPHPLGHHARAAAKDEGPPRKVQARQPRPLCPPTVVLGVCRPADVWTGDGRVGAIPARARRQGRGDHGGERTEERLDRHEDDRLPQR